ncbi:uncharacterized protein TNCV_627161 [Trichonephila clavipes]|nr:uncharacterized protein TNCV_627161 [Trichonephila clavipes]
MNLSLNASWPSKAGSEIKPTFQTVMTPASRVNGPRENLRWYLPVIGWIWDIPANRSNMRMLFYGQHDHQILHCWITFLWGHLKELHRDVVTTQTGEVVHLNAACTSFTCRNCGGGDRGRVAIYRPFGEVSLSLNRTVTCMVLKANDRRTSCPCHDEFRGPRSDYVRQVALATTTTTV